MWSCVNAEDVKREVLRTSTQIIYYEDSVLQILKNMKNLLEPISNTRDLTEINLFLFYKELDYIMVDINDLDSDVFPLTIYSIPINNKQEFKMWLQIKVNILVKRVRYHE